MTINMSPYMSYLLETYGYLIDTTSEDMLLHAAALGNIIGKDEVWNEITMSISSEDWPNEISRHIRQCAMLATIMKLSVVDSEPRSAKLRCKEMFRVLANLFRKKIFPNLGFTSEAQDYINGDKLQQMIYFVSDTQYVSLLRTWNILKTYSPTKPDRLTLKVTKRSRFYFVSIARNNKLVALPMCDYFFYCNISRFIKALELLQSIPIM